LKTLHLLRHAKAAVREMHESDFERPLARRGTAACKAIAARLAAEGFSVERVYCSPAQRTKETYALLKNSLGGAKVIYREKLYLIDAGDLLKLIGEVSNTVASVMIIGHNPGLHMTALRLTKNADEEQLQSLDMMTNKFPTGAMCSLKFDVEHWQDVMRGNGTLTAFVRPRDLS
jgi:phosphohistidine phosphatase